MARTHTKKTEEQLQENATCPRCGMARDDWAGNSGQGYRKEGQLYCCEGCAEEGECDCIEE